MPDRRLFDLGQRVQDAVDLPDFDALYGRGRRLVRTRVLAAAFVIAVVGATGITAGTSGMDSEPPAVDLPLRTLTSQQVVQHPRAELQSFAVDPDDPDLRAAVWQVPCEAVSDDDSGRLCGLARQALAVTDDGFDSTTYVPLPDSTEYPPRAQKISVQSVGAGRFYVARPYRNGSVVDTAGHLTPVTVSKRVAPLGQDESFVEHRLLDHRAAFTALALDPDAARAHVLRVARGFYATMWQDPNGTLWSYEYGAASAGERVVTSTDGGETWSRPAAVPNLSGREFRWIPSGATDTAAIARVDESIHLVQAARSTDDGRTWDGIEGPSGIAYAHWMVVRPDGSLLMQADDGRIYASDGPDWTVASPVEPGLPDALESEHAFGTYAQSVVDADGTQTVYVVGATDQAVWTSTDGRHWEETPAR